MFTSAHTTRVDLLHRLDEVLTARTRRRARCRCGIHSTCNVDGRLRRTSSSATIFGKVHAADARPGHAGHVAPSCCKPIMPNGAGLPQMAAARLAGIAGQGRQEREVLVVVVRVRVVAQALERHDVHGAFRGVACAPVPRSCCSGTPQMPDSLVDGVFLDVVLNTFGRHGLGTSIPCDLERALDGGVDAPSEAAPLSPAASSHTTTGSITVGMTGLRIYRAFRGGQRRSRSCAGRCRPPSPGTETPCCFS